MRSARAITFRTFSAYQCRVLLLFLAWVVHIQVANCHLLQRHINGIRIINSACKAQLAQWELILTVVYTWHISPRQQLQEVRAFIDEGRRQVLGVVFHNSGLNGLFEAFTGQ